jgi:hypothetical protein
MGQRVRLHAPRWAPHGVQGGGDRSDGRKRCVPLIVDGGVRLKGSPSKTAYFCEMCETIPDHSTEQEPANTGCKY